MHRIPWMPKYPYSSSYGQNYIYSWCNEENFATWECINQVPGFLWPITAFACCLYSRYFQTISSVWVASILISLELFPAHLIYSQFSMCQFPQLCPGAVLAAPSSAEGFQLHFYPKAAVPSKVSQGQIQLPEYKYSSVFKPDLLGDMRSCVVSQHIHVW